MRSRKDIEMDICASENQIEWFKGFNRKKDAATEINKLNNLKAELKAVAK